MTLRPIHPKEFKLGDHVLPICVHQEFESRVGFSYPFLLNTPFSGFHEWFPILDKLQTIHDVHRADRARYPRGTISYRRYDVLLQK